VFFFSSRRRHTRFSRDWSSDVCSSDLQAAIVYDLFHVVAKFGREVIDRVRVDETNRITRAGHPNDERTRTRRRVIKGTRWLLLRSEERRVGKEGRARWATGRLESTR